MQQLTASYEKRLCINRDRHTGKKKENPYHLWEVLMEKSGSLLNSDGFDTVYLNLENLSF